jgi:hypothetical protein
VQSEDNLKAPSDSLGAFYFAARPETCLREIAAWLSSSRKITGIVWQTGI